MEHVAYSGGPCGLFLEHVAYSGGPCGLFMEHMGCSWNMWLVPGTYGLFLEHVAYSGGPCGVFLEHVTYTVVEHVACSWNMWLTQWWTMWLIPGTCGLQWRTMWLVPGICGLFLEHVACTMVRMFRLLAVHSLAFLSLPYLHPVCNEDNWHFNCHTGFVLHLSGAILHWLVIPQSVTYYPHPEIFWGLVH